MDRADIPDVTIGPTWGQVFRADRMSEGMPYATLSSLEVFLLSTDESLIEAFFSHVPGNILFIIRILSKSLLYAVEAYKIRHWNIESFLSRWFPNPALFLSVLEQADGVVSGSEAMQFFQPGQRTFRGNDLDIYVPYHGLLTMGRFARRSGFIYQPSSYPMFDAAVLMFTAMNTDPRARVPSGSLWSQNKPKTFDFTRPASMRFGPLQGGKLQIIGVPGNPVEWIINNFHSTAVMNYLAPSYAVSVFPWTTFVDRATLVCQDVTSLGQSTTWMQKYRNRGLRIVGASDPVPCTRELRAWQRQVGDQFTWVMPYAQGKLFQTRERSPVHRYTFEVLDESFEVVLPGATLRVCPRFMFSSVAQFLNPRKPVGDYRSLQSMAIFLEDVWADSDGSGLDWSSGTETDVDEDADTKFDADEMWDTD